MRFHSLYRSETGTSLIETAIILPLWLAILLIFIWLAYMQNARQCLTTAASQAARLAFTRGNLTPFESETSDDEERYVPMGDHELYDLVRAWQISANTNPEDKLLRLLVKDSDLNSYTGNWGWDATNEVNVSGPLINAHPAYIMAIIYANEAMRIGVGNSVRYPCDPDAATYPIGDTKRGAGCLRCIVIDPVNPGSSVPGININCSFQPDTFLLRPIMNLLGIATRRGSVAILQKIVLVAQGVYGFNDAV